MRTTLTLALMLAANVAAAGPHGNGEMVPPVAPVENFTAPPGHLWQHRIDNGLIWCIDRTTPLETEEGKIPAPSATTRCGGHYRLPAPAPRSRPVVGRYA